MNWWRGLSISIKNPPFFSTPLRPVCSRIIEGVVLARAETDNDMQLGPQLVALAEVLPKQRAQPTITELLNSDSLKSLDLS